MATDALLILTFFVLKVSVRKDFKIESELKDTFGSRLKTLNYPYKESDQHIFLRALISGIEGTYVKIEILHNMKRLDDIEVIESIRLITKRDIGLYKLVSASSRKANKDIYDLNYITEDIPLIELFDDLRKKKDVFSKEEDKSIFDQDDICPLSEPKLLLAFDLNVSTRKDRPIHSRTHLDLLPDSKNWFSVKFDWRGKVKVLFKHLGVKFPSINSQSK